MKHNKKQDRDEKLVAQVLRLADLVDYQEGAVVSRTIVDKGTGTVTLFTLRAREFI